MIATALNSFGEANSLGLLIRFLQAEEKAQRTYNPVFKPSSVTPWISETARLKTGSRIPHTNPGIAFIPTFSTLNPA